MSMLMLAARKNSEMRALRVACDRPGIEYARQSHSRARTLAQSTCGLCAGAVMK